MGFAGLYWAMEVILSYLSDFLMNKFISSRLISSLSAVMGLFHARPANSNLLGVPKRIPLSKSSLGISTAMTQLVPSRYAKIYEWIVFSRRKC